MKIHEDQAVLLTLAKLALSRQTAAASRLLSKLSGGLLGSAEPVAVDARPAARGLETAEELSFVADIEDADREQSASRIAVALVTQRRSHRRTGSSVQVAQLRKSRAPHKARRVA
jgi:hypothetical protein